MQVMHIGILAHIWNSNGVDREQVWFVTLWVETGQSALKPGEAAEVAD